MPHLVEEKGISLLRGKLEEIGRLVSISDKKTFDLIVDGKYAEVKTKNKSATSLDFISLTDKQFKALKDDFKIYLVCNVKDEKNAEFYEINSRDLKKIKPKKYTSYEFNKSEIDKIKARI